MIKSVWIFDSNRRVYEDDKGNRTNSSNFRKHWVEHKIVDETSRSWITHNGRKIPKKGDMFNRIGIAFSEEEIDQLVYVKDNRIKLSERVRDEADYETLRQIEAILDASIPRGPLPS